MNILIFLSIRLIETDTVYCLVFWEYCKNVFLEKKFLFFLVLILIRIFQLIKLYISTIFIVKVNRNRHNWKNGGGKELYWVFHITCWLLFRRKLLYFSDLTYNRFFLLLKFKKQGILVLKGNRNCHSSKHWAWHSLFLFVYAKIWKLLRENHCLSMFLNLIELFCS